MCGGAGCGKTLFGMEFLIRGASVYDEPGVALLFDETTDDVAINVASLGFDVMELIAHHKLLIDYIHIDRGEIEETGEYNLDGLFVRLEHAVQEIHAKRVLLDTVETLFSGLSNASILRAELRRLFRWIKDKGLTGVITGERGNGMLTRHGFEEYVSDCVILLDNRVERQAATRWLQVVKYRGSAHGGNPYPFLIDEQGISVLPITSIGLQHPAYDERVSTGIRSLDEMLGGQGVYRGSCVLISGEAGTGKTSLASFLALAACLLDEPCVYFSFEESPSQLMRNLQSIGVDLQPWVERGLLNIVTDRPCVRGLEAHLVTIHKVVEKARPRVVVIDPITGLLGIAAYIELHSALTRLVDYLKGKGITSLFTSLTPGGAAAISATTGIESLVDTWIVLQSFEVTGERNRGLSILKSRGMPHSNLVREFTFDDHGVNLIDVYRTPDGILTGSVRRMRERHDASDAIAHCRELERRRLQLELKRSMVAAKVEALRADIEAEHEELEQLTEQYSLETRQAGGRNMNGHDGTNGGGSVDVSKNC